jgi:hypothetical protein
VKEETIADLQTRKNCVVSLTKVDARLEKWRPGEKKGRPAKEWRRPV